jgi:hypothetical protein
MKEENYEEEEESIFLGIDIENVKKTSDDKKQIFLDHMIEWFDDVGYDSDSGKLVYDLEKIYSFLIEDEKLTYEQAETFVELLVECNKINKHYILVYLEEK